MRRIRPVAVFGALTALVSVPFGVMEFAGVSAAKTTAPVPTVSGFSASPVTSFGYPGGPLTLSANITNAVSCTFTSNQPVSGFPATVPCTGNNVSVSGSLPANTGKKTLKYKFKVVAQGSTKEAHAKLEVTVAASEGCPTPAPGANLSGCNLAGARLSQVPNNFNVNLTNVNLTGTDLMGADLSDVDLTDATLINTNLTDANLFNDELSGVVSSGIVGSPTLPAGYELTDLNANNVPSGYLIGPGVKLNNVDLSGSTLPNADFYGASLVDAGFSNSILSDDFFINANLTGADFDNAYLGGVVFAGANLTGASFRGDPLSSQNIDWSDNLGVATCPDGTLASNDGGTCVNNLG